MAKAILTGKRPRGRWGVRSIVEDVFCYAVALGVGWLLVYSLVRFLFVGGE
jgi:hypothetical protein